MSLAKTDHYFVPQPSSWPVVGSIALFLMATAINYLPVALGGTTPELVAGGLLHLLLALHIGTARTRASQQRLKDLERFLTIKG